MGTDGSPGRAQRVHDLEQVIASSQVVRAEDLAERFGVSVRTIYRDVALLVGNGAPIRGEPGIGYALRGRHHVPAMAMSDDEADALALGLGVVATWGDPALAAGASALVARLPLGLVPAAAHALRNAPLVAPFSSHHVAAPECLPALRHATRTRRRLELDYVDETGRPTSRLVRPLSIAFFAPIWILTVWCELREDFRTLRADRISGVLGEREEFPVESGRELVDFLP